MLLPCLLGFLWPSYSEFFLLRIEQLHELHWVLGSPCHLLPQTAKMPQVKSACKVTSKSWEAVQQQRQGLPSGGPRAARCIFICKDSVKKTQTLYSLAGKAWRVLPGGCSARGVRVEKVITFCPEVQYLSLWKTCKMKLKYSKKGLKPRKCHVGLYFEEGRG